MKTSKLSLLLLCTYLLVIIVTGQMMKDMMPGGPKPQGLKPSKLKFYMFQNQITGSLNILMPTKVNTNSKGDIVSEEYVIDMVKTKQQLLPPLMFGKTSIYAYAGMTRSGYYEGFPGPAIFATKDRPIKITWRNKIPGPHILPVDYNYPFINNTAFQKEVPTVPHAHGIVANRSSDGEPQAYWTMSGIKGPDYSTEEKCSSNTAIYIYPNEQDAGNHWYHDHSLGITRLNVYAGLAGLYKILDSTNKKQFEVVNRYGVHQLDSKYLVITDKSFKENGQLMYNDNATNPNFSSWMPEFYGDVMLVNGFMWPKMNLKQGMHRIVLLNACQGRFLNFWFENNGKKLDFELIRLDGNFYEKPVVVNELLATISTRYEFILDLSKVTGEVIMKNNAPAPYPQGDPDNFQEEFHGNIMKISVQANFQLAPTGYQSFVTNYRFPQININGANNDGLNALKNLQTNFLQPTTTQPYPKYEAGEKVFTTLFEVQNKEGQVNVAFIDGLSMMKTMNCPNSTYDIGKTYDFYFINLTPDAHPMHFHLVNMQKVKQFKIHVMKYAEKYFKINGGKPDKYGWSKPPISLDPEEFRNGVDEFPLEHQKIFRDTIDVKPEYVTVIRIKFSKNDGTLTKNFDLKGQRYVMHCHILDHEDNEMMKYFCLK